MKKLLLFIGLLFIGFLSAEVKAQSFPDEVHITVSTILSQSTSELDVLRDRALDLYGASHPITVSLFRAVSNFEALGRIQGGLEIDKTMPTTIDINSVNTIDDFKYQVHLVRLPWKSDEIGEEYDIMDILMNYGWLISTRSSFQIKSYIQTMETELIHIFGYLE